MSCGRGAAGGDPSRRGGAPLQSHIAAMQLFHELKQQFPALPDDAVATCIAEHHHDPSILLSQLALAAAPRSQPYPDCLRVNDDERRPSSEEIANITAILSPNMNSRRKFSRSDEEPNISDDPAKKYKLSDRNRRSSSEDTADFRRKLDRQVDIEDLARKSVDRRSSNEDIANLGRNLDLRSKSTLRDEDRRSSSEDMANSRSKQNQLICNEDLTSKSKFFNEDRTSFNEDIANFRRRQDQQAINEDLANKSKFFDGDIQDIANFRGKLDRFDVNERNFSEQNCNEQFVKKSNVSSICSEEISHSRRKLNRSNVDQNCNDDPMNPKFNTNRKFKMSNKSSEEIANLSPRMNFQGNFHLTEEEESFSDYSESTKFKHTRKLKHSDNFTNLAAFISGKTRKKGSSKKISSSEERRRTEESSSHHRSIKIGLERLNLSDEDSKLSGSNISDNIPAQNPKSSSKNAPSTPEENRRSSSSPSKPVTDLSSQINPKNSSKQAPNTPEETKRSSSSPSKPVPDLSSQINPKFNSKMLHSPSEEPRSSPSKPTKDLSSQINTENISESDVIDFSPSCFRTKPPISPLSSKKPPTKATFDARITKLPENSPANATGAVRKSEAVRPASLDLPKKLSDCVENKVSPVQPGVNLSVNLNCSVEGGGAGPRRHSAVLEVTPEPTWLQSTPSYPPSPRSFTSVNLTLRTPSSEGINISSSPAPPSLTYTTSSWDRHQGLQSRLEITVAPAGGTVTSVRTRPRSSCFQDAQEREDIRQRAESMPDLSGRVEQTTNCVILLTRQKECKKQLEIELIAGKERLYSIQKEIQALRIEYTPDFTIRLKKEIRHLQAQCERLTQEVDRHSESRVPLGETNAEFYRHIYTGQRPPSRRPRAPTRVPPHAISDPDNEPRWPCHICTFRNHPLMDKCEQCEMPRVLLGKIAAPSAENPTAPAAGNPPLANAQLALGMNS